LTAAVRLGVTELRGATVGVAGMHAAVSNRVFGLLGRRAAPVRVLHDDVATAVYRALHGLTGLLGAGAVAALSRARRTPDLSVTARGTAALGIVNGLIGDDLHRRADPLAVPLSIRVDGRPVAPTADALAAAFPDASGRIVVFLHGLMESERGWWAGGRETGYPERLRVELDWTPLELRYNTGRHISENGRALAELLAGVVAGWPVPVRRIALVGHSMGGLVARSGAHFAHTAGDAWPALVSHVVTLGSPHLGAPLAGIVHHASAALAMLPETAPVARFLRRRSDGIRDLRHGSLVDEDWSGRDPDGLRAEAQAEVPLLPGAVHCFVAATLGGHERHPLGRVFGDVMVMPGSAFGRGRRRRLPEPEHGVLLGSANHFTLLNHPVVHQRLRAWLDAPTPTDQYPS